MRKPLGWELVASLNGAAFAVALLCARPARADHLAVAVTAQGRKVYINSGDPSASAAALGLSPSRGGALPQISEFVNRTARRFQLDPNLVHAMIQVESDYDPQARSRKGAMGLMQLIPATARRFGVENPFDPRQNIEGGVTYLNYLLDLFHGDVPLSLAAYNAGENSVLRAHGIPPFRETQRYVEKVTSLYRGDPDWHPRARDRESITAIAANGTQAGAHKRQATNPASAPPIYSYVDASGVVHFAQ